MATLEDELDESSEESDHEDLEVSSQTICTDAAVSILCEALDKVHSSPEYRGQSKRCTEIYHNLNMIRDSITENKTTTCVTEFAVSMVGSIQSISHQFTSTVETKSSIGKKLLQMWKTFHNYTTSESFKSNWTTCFDYLKLTGLSGEALIIQHTARVMLETFLENAISTTETTDDVPDLTPEEDNAVRFASGFIIRSLKKKLSKSETYVYTLNCMHESDSDIDIETDNFLDYTKEWVSRINRGGLFRVSDETFLLFRWMELTVRKHLCLPVRNIDISKAVSEIISSENVMSCWSVVCNLETTKSDKLLAYIAEAWVQLRGFSYVGNLIEQYKMSVASKQVPKEKKGLRKTLKQLNKE